MPKTAVLEITHLLEAWGGGDKSALNALMPMVHRELRRQAHRYMQKEQPGIAFQTSELVNEVYLKLVDANRIQWQDRMHFFAISAQFMRRILVDLARSRRYAKRGGQAQQVTFDDALEVPEGRTPDWIALDDALQALHAIDERKCRMVELRFFGGLSLEETAAALQVSPGTVARDWRFVRTWLRRELSRQGS